MKTIFKHIKILMLLQLLSSTTIAQTSVKENDYEKSKKFTQTYDLENKDKVSLSNQFGNIKIVTWADKKIKVDVDIEVAAKTEAKATKIIDGINIKHSKNDGLVSFKTTILEKDNYNNNFHVTSTKTGTKTSKKTNITTTTKTSATVITKTNKNGETETENIVGDDEKYNCNYKNNSQSMKINYTVYLPASTTLKMYNEFGNTFIEDYEGILTSNNEYGNFTANILTNKDNEIVVEYGNAEIKTLTSPDIKISYGNCDITNIIGIGKLEFSYSSDVLIGVSKNVGDIKIINEYSTIEITVNENTNASFLIKSSYGDVKNKNKSFVLKTGKEEDDECCNFTKKYEGKIGTGASKIEIDNDYGKVKFR